MEKSKLFGFDTQSIRPPAPNLDRLQEDLDKTFGVQGTKTSLEFSLIHES